MESLGKLGLGDLRERERVLHRREAGLMSHGNVSVHESRYPDAAGVRKGIRVDQEVYPGPLPD